MQAAVGETREYIIGWLTVVAGTREEFLKITAPYAADFRKEEGCLFFEACPSFDDPDGVTFTECFASAEAHNAHRGTARAGAYWAELNRFGRHLRFETITAGRVEPGSADLEGTLAATDSRAD